MKRMLSFVIVLALLVSMIPFGAVPVWAASGTCGDNLTWALDKDGTLTISGAGAMYDYYDKNGAQAPWDVYEYQITNVIIEDGITTIGNYAFYLLRGLTTVEIGNSVTIIGDHAFANCYDLASVEIGNSVTTIGDSAFINCYGLTDVNIPDSVKTIEDHAFYRCEGLTSVTIGNSVTTIGVCAFYQCEVLTSVIIPDSVITIGDSAFYQAGLRSVKIGNSVTTIGDSAFFNCGITNLEIGNSVTTIGDSAFNYCTELTSVDIPNSVTTIGSGAFAWCHSLISVTIPNSVTTIESSAFSHCGELKSVGIDDLAAWCAIEFGDSNSNPLSSYDCELYLNDERITTLTIPESVTIIGDYAFYDCKQLTGVYIPNSVTAIGNSAFYNCNGITSLTIPNSVATIGELAFYSCDGLTSVTIPGSVITVGDYAFEWCDGLTAINVDPNNKNYCGIRGVLFSKDRKTIICYPCGKSGTYSIPNSVTTIGEHAFYRCEGLTGVTIPNSVTTIGDYAFYYCRGLTGVTIPSSVNTIENSAFTYCSKLNRVEIDDLAAWCAIEFGDSDANPLSYARKLYLKKELVTNLTIPDTVATIGNYAFYNGYYLTSVDISDSVTTIGDYAFGTCTGSTEIYFDGSAPAISPYAFYKVTATAYYYPDDTWTEDVMQDYGGDITWVALENTTVVASGECGAKGDNLTWSLDDEGTLTISGTGAMHDYLFDNAPWYDHRASVKKVVVEDGVTTIGDGAFSDFSALISAELGNSVTTIGAHAFDSCGAMTTINIPASVSSIDSGAFINCRTTRVDITDLAAWCAIDVADLYAVPGGKIYLNGEPIEDLVIPEGVTAIGDYAFRGKAFNTVEIPNSVTSIGKYAFEYCSNLTSIDIPDSVTTIGKAAFRECSKLSSINVPDSVYGIGGYAFDNTPWYTALYNAQQDGLIYIGKVAYQYKGTCPSSVAIRQGTLGIAANVFTNCTPLTSVEIPESLIYIGEDAFSFCSSLDSIDIPDSVTVIDSYAFSNCSSLATAELPTSLVTIGDGSFSFTRLKSVNVPGSVVQIGCDAFRGATDLESVTIGKTVVSIGAQAFMDCSILATIKVDPENKNYCDIDGVLFNKDKTTLVAFPNGRTEDFVIPASVKLIEEFQVKRSTVLFEGSAPSVKSYYGVFDATAFYYPDETWSEDALNDCNGELTWIALPEKGDYEHFGTCGDLFWTLDAAGTLTIYGTGVMVKDFAYWNSGGPWGEHRDSIKRVVIKDGVTTVGYSAFENFENLTNVEIGNSVTIIQDNAFLGCTSLTSVELGTAVETIDYYAFNGCTSLKSLHIPASIATIKNYAFSGCSGLTEITVDPNNPNYCSDEQGALYNKEKTSLIYFPQGKSGTYSMPKTVTSLSQWALTGCFELAAIEVDPENPKYSNDEHGVLFNKDKTTLLQFPGGKGGSYTVPETVTAIATDAFSRNTTLTDLVIKGNVLYIYSGTFYGCTALNSIKITGTIGLVQDYAFDGCSNLTEIYFEGYIPSFLEDAFKGVTATAYYYPDMLWDESDLQDYGGDITWVKMEPKVQIGDFSGDGYVTDEDVIWLLWYTVFPEDYPLNQSGDFDGDGLVTDADVIYLLWHTVFPEDYPLKK